MWISMCIKHFFSGHWFLVRWSNRCRFIQMALLSSLQHYFHLIVICHFPDILTIRYNRCKHWLNMVQLNSYFQLNIEWQFTIILWTISTRFKSYFLNSNWFQNPKTIEFLISHALVAIFVTGGKNSHVFITRKHWNKAFQFESPFR